MEKKTAEEIESYDMSKLKYMLKRMEKIGLIQRVKKSGKDFLEVSDEGKKFLIEYSLSKLKKPDVPWNGKWRIVMYDISLEHRNQQQKIRRLFTKLGFFQMQKSVYLYPYDCTRELSYIRSGYGMYGEIQLIVAESIEKDSLYRQHFKLT